ncbi:MAG: T9SS type A sorting domain-containing protein [Bacteroidaceae bacterium]|nr:T9SS type A sorting domain-containing protein [Bacteroidaceae bacterium]
MSTNFFKLLLPLLVSIPLSLSAATPDDADIYLYTKASSTPKKMALEEIDKLTFNSNGIQVWKQKGIETISFADFQVLTFGEIERSSETAIEQIAATNDVRVRYYRSRSQVVVESEKAMDGVSIYDMRGRLIANETSSGTRYILSLTSAPRGIYLVQARRGADVIVNKFVK